MSRYDKFAEEYIKVRNNGFSPNKHIEMPAMFRMVGDIKGKLLLDLGCGFGTHAEYYSKRGAKVIGVDQSSRFIEYARSKSIKNAEFFIYDLNRILPFPDNYFDIITSSYVLGHIRDLELLCKECFRILKIDGNIIFSVNNPVLYQEQRIAGRLKKGNKTIIFGDYFNRRKIKTQLGSESMKIEHYHRTLEDYFSILRNSEFTLLDFKEPKPVPSSKKIDAKAYEIFARNPYLLLFKLRK